MTILTDIQLQAIRTRPQQTKLHLSLFSPSTMLACQVTGTVAKSDRVISYYGVSTGTYTNVETGMTLLVGSTPGGFDAGRVRTKSATANTVTVAENSHINWTVGQYLTIIKYWDVWPVYPRIIHDPSNDENVIFYKDYDVVYTNQNSVLGTFVCSGPHRAKYIDNGAANVYFSSSGTFNPVLGSSVGHYWTFEGGNPSVFAGPEPGYIQYTAPGHYVAAHTVTGSNGCSDISYRYVSVYPRPSVGNPTTIQDFTIESGDGSRDSGGYTAKIKIHQRMSNPVIPGTVVVIFAETLYGGAPGSYGGNSVGNENIFLVSYVLDGTISYDYEKSQVEFEVGSVTELMKIAEGFSISVEDIVSPSKWFELLQMDARRAIYHFLRWHSTVLSVTDFQFVGTDYPIQFFDADRESLYDAINSFLGSTLIGELTSDRQGKLWAEVAARATPTTITPSIMLVDRNDWMGEPSIKENVNGKMSYLELGGIAFSGASTGTFSALMACAPGNAPAYRGKVERSQGLALATQAQLNQLAGDVLENKNSRFPTIDMSMAGLYPNLDIAPQQKTTISIAQSDTQRNVLISGSYIPQSISFEYDSEDLILLPKVGFQSVLSGSVGETIAIPNVPPGGGYSPPPFSIPGLPLPLFGYSATSTIRHCTWQRASSIPSICFGDDFQWALTPITGDTGIVSVDSGDLEHLNLLLPGTYYISCWGNDVSNNEGFIQVQGTNTNMIFPILHPYLLYTYAQFAGSFMVYTPELSSAPVPINFRHQARYCWNGGFLLDIYYLG